MVGAGGVEPPTRRLVLLEGEHLLPLNAPCGRCSPAPRPVAECLRECSLRLPEVGSLEVFSESKTLT